MASDVILRNLIGLVKTHKLGKERVWSPEGYKVRFSIKPDGEIKFKSEGKDETSSLGMARDIRTRDTSEAIQLLAKRAGEFDHSKKYSGANLLRATAFDGSLKLFDTLTGGFLKSLPPSKISSEFQDPAIVAQFSIRNNENFRENTNDVSTVLHMIAEEHGGYPVSYKYFPAQDILLLKKGVSNNSEYATLYKQSSIDLAPNMEIFHHVHQRSLSEPIEEAYDVLEEGCTQFVSKLEKLFKDDPVTLKKLRNRVSSLQGTMNWGWDGKYDGYVFMPETHKHPMLQESYLALNSKFEELQKYNKEQGSFNRNIWVTAIAKCGDDNLYLIKSPQGFWITRYIASFEEARYASPLSQYYGQPVEYNLKTPSFAGHDFAHLLSSLKNSADLADAEKQYATQSRIQTLSKSTIIKLASREDQLKEYEQKLSYERIAGDALAATQRLAAETLEVKDMKAYGIQCERMVGLLVDVIAYHLMPTPVKKISLSFFGGEDGLRDIVKQVFDLV